MKNVVTFLCGVTVVLFVFGSLRDTRLANLTREVAVNRDRIAQLERADKPTTDTLVYPVGPHDNMLPPGFFDGMITEIGPDLTHPIHIENGTGNLIPLYGPDEELVP